MAAAGTAHLDVSDATGSVAWERGSNSGGSGCSGSPVRDDAQTTMDALSSEVLDLKTCVRAHEDRLAALYGTKDRSMWTGTPSLLVKRRLYFCWVCFSPHQKWVLGTGTFHGCD